MKKKEKLFLGGEINLSELDADVQKKYEVAKELGIYDKVLEERTPGKEFFLSLA